MSDNDLALAIGAIILCWCCMVGAWVLTKGE